jgi:hypothetical protein
MGVSRPLLLLVAVALVAGCSDDGGGDDDGATLGDTAPPTSVTAPEAPAASPAGSGIVVIGGSQSPFTVTECQLEPADDPTTLVLVTGAGTTGTGVPFQVEVKRLATSTAAAETFTDTITYTDTARILQLQRFEVEGEVSDLRDPSARGTLLRVRPGGLSASGLAGPPGTGATFDEGIVGMALDATC